MLPILWVRKRRLRGTFPGHPAKKQVSKDSPSCLSPSPCSLGYRTSSLGGSLGRGGVEAHREPGEPGGLALECRKTTENHPPPSATSTMLTPCWLCATPLRSKGIN